MNVWSGAIALDEKSQLRGVQLIDRSTNWQSDIPKDSTLSFCSFVNPALIPLYARIGPNLELHTTDPETSQWLKHKFLGNIWLEDEDLDCFQTIQCPVGFLVSLDGAARPRSSGVTTTDLLVYGILSTVTTFERPPTPPVSSSPETEEPISDVVKQELRIYAAPISGSLIAKAQALATSHEGSGAITGDEQFGQFLPDFHSPSPKRKRVATLFESVAQHHKRVRERGGEAVSQLMAHSLSQSSQQLQGLRIKRESEEPGLPILSKIASHRSRSLSISNLNPNKAAESRPEHPRSSSNRGHARELVSKRGTPLPFSDASTRRDRGASPSLLSSEDKIELRSGPKDADTVISENKNIITRTILTCMRLYGFNRSAPRSATSTKPPAMGNHHDVIPLNSETQDSQIPVGEGPASNAHGEDEFKAMYHATYRASTFALRKYLKESPVRETGSKSLPPILEKEKAMTYIDGFLKLFCEEEN
ncbi:hypothetical protein P175DRAFT_0463631 [Aspergillus ochraceoroseus IBT 24754]|uniref:Sld7 C-terminal domain-containing protein n=2 Tax=Aspergillus ochraceoroseus TaxID=138278 RepID=A0A2T5LR09_9EURO|nr:uncharacterized protein P175DRAFT_0463631 [Aspergillus ochraceoroseus IBT 24754]KKK17857.1 hypothetical protein AOCH_004941 [Aspergillus ochraceoroseus]PTU18720.1 hypothetical protein P175DRAFT_0463631 [Aspergillus ochraceoroseus IBT 24754]